MLFIYNYYVYKGSDITDLDNDDIADAIVKAVNKGEKIVHLYINPNNLNFSKVYKQLFGESYGFANYIYDANDRLEDKKLNTNTYVAKKIWLNTITVVLDYE